ncbi:MAG: hypothetical protein QNK23_00995 [Crocinitomicaceae bacterium]|nr:hypothetical protein [Crocinitomicaceae bacterium]
MIKRIKSFLQYDKYPANGSIIGVAFLIFGSLTVISFLYAFALDEGTLGDNPTDIFIANSFNIWRFPSHTLLWPIIDILPFLAPLIFIFGLLFNMAFYSFIVERIFTRVFKRRK